MSRPVGFARSRLDSDLLLPTNLTAMISFVDKNKDMLEGGRLEVDDKQ